MTIEKKSLISTLRTTKKANVASLTPAPEVVHKMNKIVPKKPKLLKAAPKLAKTAIKKMY